MRLYMFFILLNVYTIYFIEISNIVIKYFNKNLAAPGGFEPSMRESKSLALTAWLRSYIL